MKTADEIYGEMCEVFTQRTGVSINDRSDMAVRMYAAATQIYSLYVYNDWVKAQSFPQTAAGAYLDYHAEMRGIIRIPETAAQGFIRFRINELRETAVTVPKGTVCMALSGVEFHTTDDTVIAAGELYCDAPALARIPGESGNAAESSIIFMTAAPIGVAACTNIERFKGGANSEDDESLRQRVIASYNKLPNGANAAFYEKIVLNMENVAAVNVIPKNRGLGTVDIVVTSTDGLPSPELLGEISEKLESMREICVDIEVDAPVIKTVQVKVMLDVQNECDISTVSENVETVIEAYFNGTLLGRDILLARIGDIIFNVPGVNNYKIISPVSDVSVSVNELPVCAGVTITNWS